jgi:hypothetical protein
MTHAAGRTERRMLGRIAMEGASRDLKTPDKVADFYLGRPN